MPRTFPIATIRGIPVRAHPSAGIAFVLLLMLLAQVYFPALLPEIGGPTHWSVGFVSTLFLFLSTVAHELGHSLVARARGIQVESITLVMFGGTSNIQRDGQKPLDELLISVSGPSTSLVLAGLAALARITIPNQSQPLMLFLESVFLLNVWLGVFNLLPTLPLDGGQAIRGLLWLQMGDYQRATRLASLAGRAVAALFLAAGIALLVVTIDVERSPISTIAGYDPRMVAVIAILVAWFINNGARAAYRQVMLQGRFAGVTVAEVMTPEPVRVTPWTSLDEVVNRHFLQRGERAVPVVRDDTVLMGLVAYSDVRRVPRPDWPKRAAGEVMTPTAQLVTVSPQDALEAAVRHMAERHLNQLPVVAADGRLVGMIARVNVLRFLEMKQ